MRVTVIGAQGLVGSAFVRYLSRCDLELLAVTRDTYAHMRGTRSDIVIEAACNARKYLAADQPVQEYNLSVLHRLRTLHDFPADFHLHISSVDVYNDLTAPSTTHEDMAIDPHRCSHYGFHKLLAEQLVRHYASRWLIVRLAGMVGPGLRKNPVYDLLHGLPLCIHPDSQYQFMLTDEVAQTVWGLVEQGITDEIFNLCGHGLISPREIAQLAGCTPNLTQLDPATQPRIVHINTDKIGRLVSIPKTCQSVATFVNAWLQQRGQ